VTLLAFAAEFNLLLSAVQLRRCCLAPVHDVLKNVENCTYNDSLFTRSPYSGGQTGEWALVQEEQMGPLLIPEKFH